MVKITEERKDINEENKDILKTWADSYAAVSKIWEDSYVNLYKPWIESSSKLFEKSVDLSKEASPEKYKEFYDECMKAYKDTFGKFYPVSRSESDRETLEKLIVSAEESNKIFKSWIGELEENSRKTLTLFEGAPDPDKYREYYSMWMKSYEKIFDDLLAMPAMESTKGIFENYSGIPNIYLRNFAQMSKLWKDSYANLYWPWADSMFKLSGKIAEISSGYATPEAYKEFYSLWMKTYQETSGRSLNVPTTGLSKEMLETFLNSTDIYLNLYKSWINALEKLSEKTRELSTRTADPEAYKEFYALWIKTYEKAFDDFFENMPAVDPMKQMMEPAKKAAKIYADTFINISKMGMKPGILSTSQA
jgi:hypothetical protein